LIEFASKIAISDIKIGPRFRKDFGDLRPLIESVKRHGLLHPIVVSAENNQLICGKRRLAAYMQLGRPEIEVNLVWDPKQHKIAAELSEGQCCWNHIVGLPTKNNKEYPLFDYE
jgi:ParB-like chromosome segregation protein Spo0J